MLPMKNAVISLILPEDCEDEITSSILRNIDNCCDEMGVCIASSSIIRSGKQEFPLVGSVSIVSYGDRDKYLSPVFVDEDDDIIVTKQPGIAAAALLLAMFPKTIASEFGEIFVHDSFNIFDDVSILKELDIISQLLKKTNGIKAVWSAAEKGVLGGLLALAERADKGFCIDTAKLANSEHIEQICRFFELDPLFTLGYGSLIIVCSKDVTSVVLQALEGARITASRIGQIKDKSFGQVGIKMGLEIPILSPKTDVFWSKFFDLYNKGLE